MKRLTCSDLSASEFGINIFKNVSFEASCSKPFCIRGCVGSGKSLLLRVIAGLAKKDFGSIALLGPSEQSIMNLSFYLNLTVGLYEELTVYDNLKFWAMLSNSMESLEMALFYFELNDLRAAKLFKLSFSLKLRVSFARLFLVNREIWLLDEPFASIDALTSELLVRAIVAKCESKNGIVIFSENEHHKNDFLDTVDIYNMG